MKTYQKWQQLVEQGGSHGSFEQFICNELDQLQLSPELIATLVDALNTLKQTPAESIPDTDPNAGSSSDS